MTRQRFAIAADWVFDGAVVRPHHAVVVEAETIADVVPRLDAPNPVHSLPEGAWLAPGFIDIQVNGGGDILFNDDPSPEAIAAITAAHRRFGTTSLLPTVITDSLSKMRAARAAVEAAMHNHSVLGIHFEGPWLSPGKPGIHDPAHIRPPARDEIEVVAAPGRGVVVVTLAPEEVPADLIGELARAGTRVSLGHSMASYAETKAAIAQGLTGFTHLFNAMRPIAARHPGPIVAALETPGVWYGMIADGVHVDFAVLKLALRSLARPMLVSDAMPPVGGSRSSFTLQGRKITLRDGRCTVPDGTLAGAALDMATAVRNCVEGLDMPLTAALRAASAEPANFLGISDRLGRLKPGCRADMVALDPGTVEVLATWVAGQSSDQG
ncbi:MAG TPA: N-acetylglucosamine-6-phosphate deacetylase [Aestuariivirgaceae bacterium]|nr:N-acetylglucosamine-6-phosphate deacetylase [Aestuariivirgaceae bacterium]